MQRKFLSFLFSLLVVGAVMAESTTDSVVVSGLNVALNGDSTYFTVSLEGSRLYSAYDIQLQLPDGLEVVYDKGAPKVQMFKRKTDIYPYTEEEDPFEGTTTITYSHVLSSNVIGRNTLRVMCISMSNENLTATSGRLFGVYVKATPYLKPGDVEILVKEVCLTTAEAVEYKPADEVRVAGQAGGQAGATTSLTLYVSVENKYGTCILPFDFALPADGSLKAYTCSGHTDDALVLERKNHIEAYKPYVLYAEYGFEQEISGTVDATKYPEGGILKNELLVGTVVRTEVKGDEFYVLQNQDSKVGPMFYQVGRETSFAVPAGKCYVELPAGSAGAPSFRMGEATAIGDMPLIKDDEAVIYNVLGQRVNRMQAGRIYIVNGRKVIM